MLIKCLKLIKKSKCMSNIRFCKLTVVKVAKGRSFVMSIVEACSKYLLYKGLIPFEHAPSYWDINMMNFITSLSQTPKCYTQLNSYQKLWNIVKFITCSLYNIINRLTQSQIPVHQHCRKLSMFVEPQWHWRLACMKWDLLLLRIKHIYETL